MNLHERIVGTKSAIDAVEILEFQKHANVPSLLGVVYKNQLAIMEALEEIRDYLRPDFSNAEYIARGGEEE